MKCIIFGDREVTDATLVAEAIEQSGFTITEVVCGDCRGADLLGEEWAKINGIKVKNFPAEWDDITVEGATIKLNKWGKQYNSSAGFQRNQKMADYADCGIGLQPDGNTAGTQDMKKKLDKLKKPVFILGPKNDDRYSF